MPRLSRPLFLLPVIVALAACGDRERPSPTQPVLFDLTPAACDATVQNRAYALIDMLWVPGTPEKNAKGHFTAMRQKLKEDNLAEARFYMWSIIRNGNERIDKSEFKDPNGTSPPTIGQATSELYGLLLVCGAFPISANFSDAVDKGGGIAVFNEEGGDLITKDGDAGTRVPPGALEGDHLFVITPHDELNVGDNCFKAGVKEYGLCMDFAVHPNTTFKKAVTNVVCTHPFGPPDEHDEHGPVHDRLNLASEDHANPGGIIIHGRAQDPLGLDCIGAAQARLDRQSANTFYARSGLRKLTRLAASAFAPKTLHAADGLGCLLFAFGTKFRPVDATFYEEGFESESGWTPTGFWNRSTLAEIVNTGFPTHVALAPDDESEGFLPSPFEGSWAFWYGEPARGHFGGALQSSTGIGGTSLAANSGTLTSPVINVPNVSGDVVLRFHSWFEIEGVNPAGFDRMIVEVVNAATGAATSFGRLNPATDPTNPADRRQLPFTSAGFNVAPTWRSTPINLAAFRGTSIRLRFRFETGDVNYNAFRGWIVDNIVARAQPVALVANSSLSLSVQSDGSDLPLNTSPVPDVAERESQ